MRHFFSEMNETSLTFTDIEMNDHEIEYIEIHYERPSEKHCFDYLDATIPDFNIIKSKGFSEKEIEFLKQYAINNSDLIWQIAREDVNCSRGK